MQKGVFIMYNKIEKDLLRIINIMTVILVIIRLSIGYFDHLEGTVLALLLVCDIFEICSRIINKRINKREEA